jgi:type I restriction enzyme, S subunit
MIGASGRQRVRSEALSTALVPSAPLPIQRRIVYILAAYDDLIEVNRQRISVTEEIAQRLFEEWFVHLRFPGHERSSEKPVNKPSPIPKGWRLGSAGELIDFDPPTRFSAPGRKPFVPMSSLSTTTSHIGEIEWREGSGSAAKFQNFDTLFARITPCLENGKTGLVRDLPGEDGAGFGSTEFIVMRGRSVGPAFCYLLARHDAFREHARRSMSGASGRQRVRTDSLRAFRVNIPPAPVLKRFEAMAWPLLELSGYLGATNTRLLACRDLLLPRLISGELSVSAAERELETAA